MSNPTSAQVGRPGRRRLLQVAVVAVGALPLAACQDGPLRTPAGEDGQGPAAPDPDEALLDAAARAEAQMVSLLRPLVASGPAALRRTVRVHEAHLALLEHPDAGDPGAGRRMRLSAIAAAEERLARRHTEAAVRASSGQFARMLAGMAAAAAQQADVLRQSGDGP